MKTKLFIIGLIAITIISCSFPGYLPSSGEIDVNEYGSYIILKQKSSLNIDGELIAIDSKQVVVLTEEANQCVTVPLSELKGFSLRYAKPKHPGWTIPVTLLTLTHGWYIIFTAPLNFIVTVSAENNTFRYSTKHLTYDKLKMFARFPQGIPPNIDLATIQ